MTTGQLIQAVTLFSVLSFPLRVVGYFLEDAPMAVVVARPGRRGAGRRHAVGAAGDAERLPPDGPLGVEVVGVGHRLGGVAVLHDVTFALAPGEVVALVGATGSGKSTLCELLVRLADPDAGRIAIGGVALDDRRSRRPPPRVALVLQEAFLFADPVAANVLPPRLRSRRPRRRRGRRTAGGAGWALAAGRTGSWPASRPGRTRAWASGASRSPAASASGSRWPGRWPCSRAC